MNKDFILKTPIAHRGGFFDNKKVFENSLSAFKIARDKGYGIELDVQLLKDGGAAVFHHPTLDMERLLNRKGEDLRNFTTEELKICKFIGTDESVPTLKQVVELINGKVPMLIEIKAYTYKTLQKQCKAVCDVLKDYKGDFVIQSFDPRVLKWFRKIAPDMTLCVLVSPWPKSDIYRPKTAVIRYIQRNMWFVKSVKPDFIAYHADFLPCKLVNRKYPNLPILGWVIRSEQQFEKVASYLNNIIFQDFTPDPKVQMGAKTNRPTKQP